MFLSWINYMMMILQYACNTRYLVTAVSSSSSTTCQRFGGPGRGCQALHAGFTFLQIDQETKIGTGTKLTHGKTFQHPKLHCDQNNSRCKSFQIRTEGGRGRLFSQSRIFSTDSASSSDSEDSFISTNKEQGAENKARIVFLGTPDVAAASLLSLLKFAKNDPYNCCYDVVGVVTQPPKRRRRKGKPEPTPVAKIATAYGMPDSSILTPMKASDPSFLDTLENDLKPDLCITAAYGQYLPKRFLAMPSLGTINIHPSLLPRWRGASPVQRSLEAEDDPIGVSLLYTVSKMDAGPIICQKRYHCGPNEQATDVLAYLFGLGTACLIEALPDVVAGRMTFEKATVQNDNEVVKASMIDVTEGELKPWKESATCAHNKVRGFSTWPGTWLYLNIGGSNSDNESPTRLKVIETRVRSEKMSQDDNRDQLSKRTVKLGSQKGSGLLVTCYDGSVLELLKVQPETKKVMDAKSFVNGLRGQSVEWVVMPEKETTTSDQVGKQDVAAAATAVKI